MSNNLDEITTGTNTTDIITADKAANGDANENESTPTTCGKKNEQSVNEEHCVDSRIAENLSNLSFENYNSKDETSSSNTIGKAQVSKVEKTTNSDNNQSHAQVFNITGSSLSNLLAYGSSGESDFEDNVLNVEQRNVNAVNESSSSSSSSSSDEDDSFAEENDVIEALKKGGNSTTKELKKRLESLQDTLAQLGELAIDDLPPVPHANAQVKAEECDQIGKVSSIIDKLVMVESIPNKPAYDIDTLLFLENGKRPLGYIFDVIGPVTNPLYAIRFNSTQDIEAQNITKGMCVYSAPKSEHSHYVFVQQLLKHKGSDASWMDDMEVPKEFEEYSDDEAEYYCVKPASRKRNSLERHKNFEKDMNVRNLVDTKLHRVRDSCEPKTKKLYFPPATTTGSNQSNSNSSSGAQVKLHHQHHHQQQQQQQQRAPSKNHPSHLQVVSGGGVNNAANLAAQAAAHCAFRPPYCVYAPTTLNPFAAQFVPNAQRMPPIMPPMPPQLQTISFTGGGGGLTNPQQQQSAAAPQIPDHHVAAMFRNIPITPPTLQHQQAKCSQQQQQQIAATSGGGVLYPPDMGLPSHNMPPPQQQGRPPLVTNIPYYTPVMWSNFANPPPPPPGTATVVGPPNASAATATAIVGKSYRKPRKHYYKKRQN